MVNADLTYCQSRSGDIGIVSAFSSRNSKPEEVSGKEVYLKLKSLTVE